MLPDATPQQCASGASLGCTGTGTGTLRVQPESMLPGNDPEYLAQCLPCYERAAEKYTRVLHKIGEQS